MFKNLLPEEIPSDAQPENVTFYFELNRNIFNNPDFLFEVQAFGKCFCEVLYPFVESCWGFPSEHLWDTQSCSHSLGFPRPQQPSCSRVPILSPKKPWEPQLSVPQSSDTALGKEADDPSVSRRLVKHKSPQAALWDVPGAHSGCNQISNVSG